MAYIRKKLNNRRGASILIAMILLLVASMVSIVIISASLTATRRAKSERDYTQQTLYVQSAAELFKACLKNTACTVSQTVYEYENGDTEDEGVVFSCSGAALGSVLCEAVQEVEGLDPRLDQTKTEEKTLTIAADGVPVVTVTFRMYNEDNKDDAENIVRFADAATASHPSYQYTMIGTVELSGESSVKMYFRAWASGQYHESTTNVSKTVGEEDVPGTKTVKTLTMNGWDASLYTFATARGGT